MSFLSRSTRLWVPTGLALSLPLFAQTPASPAGPESIPTASAPRTQPTVRPLDEDPIKLEIPDGSLELMLKTIELWTGRTILRPASLPGGNYTLVMPSPMTKSEAMVAIETLLAMNNIAIAPLGDKFIKIVPAQSARTEGPETIVGSTLELPASGRIASKVFQLDFLRVQEFLPQIAGFLNPQLGGAVPFDKTNAFMLTDSVSNLQRIERLLLELDKPVTANLTPKFYSLRFAKASDLVTKLRTILQGNIANQLGSATTFSPDDRTNQVILIADPRQHRFFDDLITKLDVKADPNTRNEVLYLKHAAAKDVASVLSQLISGQSSAASKSNSNSVRPGQIATTGQPAGDGAAAPAAPAAPAATVAVAGPASTTEFSSYITVIADERSNAVVVSGTVDDIRLITELVAKIDVLLTQVRLEVVIVEVSLTDQASSGISSLGLQVTGDKLTGVIGSAAGVSLAPDTSGDSAASYATIGHNLKDLSGIVSLSTTPRLNNAALLQSSTITTTHNKAAKIFVGETRPVISGTTTSTTTGTTSSVTQQEIGLTITVTPLIGNDGSVQLDIKQDIQDVAGTVTVDDNDQYIITKRNTESFNNIHSGEILVLGGLQKSSNSKTTNRLGPIPIIGDLLGSRKKETKRTEILFFLRPTVLTETPADNAAAYKSLTDLPNGKEALDKLGVPPPASDKPADKAGPSLKRPK